MASTYALEKKINQLENQLTKLQQSKSLQLSEIDALRKALSQSKRQIESLDQELDATNTMVEKERRSLRAKLNQEIKNHKKQLAQIDQQYQAANQQLKKQLDIERKKRIQAHKVLTNQIQAQEKEIEHVKDQFSRRIEQDRKNYQNSLDALYQQLKQSEKYQLEKIQSLRHDFEQYIHEKSRMAEKEYETARRILLSVSADVLKYSHLSEKMDAKDAAYRIESRKEMISIEMLQVNQEKNIYEKQSASNRLLLFSQLMRADTNAWYRFVNERLQLCQKFASQYCNQCDDLLLKLDHLESLFFPEIQQIKSFVYDMKIEIVQAYTLWHSFERLSDHHQSIINEVNEIVATLPVLIQKAKTCDQKRLQLAAKIIKAFTTFNGAPPVGTLDPVCTDMSDYRSDRRIEFDLGIFSLHIFFTISGNIRVEGNDDLKIKFLNYLSDHALVTNNHKEINDFYAPQKQFYAMQAKRKKLMMNNVSEINSSIGDQSSMIHKKRRLI